MLNEKKWYQLSIEQIFETLNSNPNGLTSKEAKFRLEKYGYNELKVEKKSPVIRFLLQFRNPLLYVLIVAAAVCLVLGIFMEVDLLTDTYVIVGVVLATAIIGFIQEDKAESSLQALEKMLSPQCMVIRDGEVKKIPSRELVPGDVVILESGDRVPADLRLFSAKSLFIDESMLTGESSPVQKGIETVLKSEIPPGEQCCMAFSGTFVTRGRGQGIVVGTGENTEIGKIARIMKKTQKIEPPIVRKISEFTRFIIIAIISFGILVFGLGLLLGYNFVYMFLATVSMIVALIPEGLAGAVIVAFAAGATFMARRNALIRRLPAVETLGSTTVICSDKTGTLTKNEMTVVKIHAGGKDYEVTGVGYVPKGDFILGATKIEPQDNENIDLLECLRGGLHCNNSELVSSEQTWNIEGDPTEGALVVAAAKAGLSRNLPKLDEIPFEPEQRYMATLHRVNNSTVIYVKGSPEKILDMCQEQLVNGNILPLEPENIKSKVNEMAKAALRVIAIAYKYAEKEKTSLSEDDLNGFVFLGLQGMIDPPRPEAIEAIKKCETAGIRVVMITGDHVETAKAIANQLGISKDSLALTGEDLQRMSDDELYELVEKVNVYARVSPEHKYRIVKQLQRKGHIVAVTGDGVNDAPALKKADIGVAMGLTGTEVAKEASDMVLTDDNFASIVAAVEEGRHVYTNIWKVLLYIMPTNGGQGLSLAGAVLLSPLLPIFALRLPIEPVQILWVNLIIAICCAVPLIWEPKEKDILNKPPRDPNEKLFNRLFIIRVGLVSVVEMITVFTTFILFYSAMGNSELYLAQAQTLVFTAIILVETTYLFTARSIHDSAFKLNPFSNKRLIIGWTITICSQLLIIYSRPLFGFSPFRTEPFPPIWWLLLLAMAPAGFFAVEIEKFLKKYERKI